MKKAILKIDGKEIEVEITQEQFEKLCPKKKKTGYERVENNNVYYYVRCTGAACRTVDSYTDIDDSYYKTANYYPDETVAENNARADKLMRQLRRFAVEKRTKGISWNPHNVSDKYYIYYNHNDTSLDVYTSNLCQTFGTIYFDDEYIARLAIDRFRDELLWYFTEYKDSL